MLKSRRFRYGLAFSVIYVWVLYLMLVPLIVRENYGVLDSRGPTAWARYLAPVELAIRVAPRPMDELMIRHATMLR